MALFDAFIDFKPIYQKITEARNVLTVQIAELKGELMATAIEVKMKLARLTTEVSESVEAISALRADVQALKGQIGNAEALQAAIDEIDASLGGLSDKLDAAQNPQPDPAPEG